MHWVTLAAAVAAAPLAAQSTADDVFRSGPGGILTHANSGMGFPERIAGFVRTTEVVFDSSGEYVGVAYSRPMGSNQAVELRVAVVRIERMSPRAHYLIAKPIALRGIAGARTRSEGPYTRPGAGPAGYHGLFAGTRDGVPVGVGLWTFDRGRWDVRATGTFPAARENEGARAIGEFVAAFRGLDPGDAAPPR